MKRASKHPEPLYHKAPARAPITVEETQAAAADVGQVGPVLDDLAEVIRRFLDREGVSVSKRLPKGAPRAGVSYVSVDGGVVCYRKADHHPAVAEAVDVLQKIESVRSADGDPRVLAAMALGAAHVRFETTAAYAGIVTARRRIDAARARIHATKKIPDSVKTAVATLDKKYAKAHQKPYARARHIASELSVPQRQVEYLMGLRKKK